MHKHVLDMLILRNDEVELTTLCPSPHVKGLDQLDIKDEIFLSVSFILTSSNPKTFVFDTMVRLSALALAWLAAATAPYSRSAVVHAEEVPQDVVTGAFLLECEGESLQSLIKTVQEHGGEIRREFNSKIFYGFSAQLPNATVVGNELEYMPGVKKVWQVQVAKHQGAPPAESPVTQESAHQRRAVESSWNHIMTQIDKLHADKKMGSGIQIAVVDTGVSICLHV